VGGTADGAELASTGGGMEGVPGAGAGPPGAGAGGAVWSKALMTPCETPWLFK